MLSPILLFPLIATQMTTPAPTPYPGGLGGFTTCSSLTADYCFTDPLSCEVNNDVDPPECVPNRCLDATVDTCPTDSKLCQVWSSGNNTVCSTSAFRLACSLPKDYCGDGDAEHCEFDEDLNQCVLRDFAKLCAERDAWDNCFDEGGCDIDVARNMCVPSDCELVANVTVCNAMPYCEWNPAQACNVKTSCEAQPFLMCSLRHPNTNCGWRDGRSCTSCSAATTMESCDEIGGCEWSGSECLSLRHYCARRQLLPTCMATVGCRWYAEEQVCIPWRGSDEAHCPSRGLLSCIAPHCRLQGVNCAYRPAAELCTGSEAFRCIIYPQCYWDRGGKRCLALSDVCKFQESSESCLNTRDENGKSCTWIANAETCTGNVDLGCEERDSKEECNSTPRCLWHDDQCHTVSGCENLPKEYCNGDFHEAVGVLCEWDEDEEECEMSDSVPICESVDTTTACGNTACENLASNYQGKRILTKPAHGWTGMEGRYGIDDRDAATGALLCPPIPGVVCPICQPPYVFDPYVIADCRTRSAQFSGQICKLPEEVCDGDWTKCGPRLIRLVAATLSGAAVAPSVCLSSILLLIGILY